MRKAFAAGVTAFLMTVAGAETASANPPDLEFRNGGIPGQNGFPRGGPVRGQGFQGPPGPRGGPLQGGPVFRRGPAPYAGAGDGRFTGNGYRRHNGAGAAFGAGVAGLAAGAVIGGALANRQDYDGDGYQAPIYAPGADYAEEVVPEAEDPSDCAARYRSYDPDSGTYLGYDGLRHPCP